MDDARHVGVGEFYSAFGVVFVWHDESSELPVGLENIVSFTQF
jgi:hypothetical protein